MNPTTDQTNYLAFISYRHADNTEEDRQWATWLHQQLEVYDIPADLIGSTNQRGEIIPERIYPVFRDEISLPADSNLASAITTALDNSNFLIVLCSPRSVQSQYVNDEILYFKQIGKKDRIMAALLLGEPSASIDDAKEEDPEDVRTLECFPKALQYHLKESGELDTTSRTEPIAANFRLPDGSKGLTNPSVYKQQLLKSEHNKKAATRLSDSYEEQLNNAKLKIIAGILGVQLEQLTQRDKIFQLNKARAASKRFMRIAAIMTVLSIAALAATGAAYIQWQRAEQEKQRVEKLLMKVEQIRGNMKYMNIEVRDMMDKYVPRHIRVKTQAKLDDIAVILQRDEKQRIEVQHNISTRPAHVFIKDKLNLEASLLEAQESFDTLKKRLLEEPSNTNYQRAVSVSYSKLGNIQLRLGDNQAALVHYQTSLELDKKLRLQDPNNTRFQRDLSVSYNKLGNIQLRLGDTQAALDHYQASLELRKKLRLQDPDNIGFQRDLSVAYNNLGNIQLRLGDTQAALVHYQASLELGEKLSQLDPDNSQYQQDLIYSYDKIASVFSRLEKYQQAIDYQKKIMAVAAENSGDTIDALGSIGWYQLLLGDFKSAQASSLKAYTQKPSSLAWGINLAHTYWLHQKDEQRAKTQFLEVLPKIKDNDFFQKSFKADFKIFAEKGWCPQGGLCQKLEKWLDVEWQKELKSR